MPIQTNEFDNFGFIPRNTIVANHPNESDQHNNSYPEAEDYIKGYLRDNTITEYLALLKEAKKAVKKTTKTEAKPEAKKAAKKAAKKK